jgi:tetratricopeptide (TPR) repeat protein
MAGDTAACIRASDYATALEVDPPRRIQIFLYTSRSLAQVGAINRAQACLDSAARIGKDDPSIGPTITWTQAQVYRAAGRYAAAESAYRRLLPIAPELYLELSDMYRTGLGDNVRAEAALDSWYGTTSQDWPSTSHYVEQLVSAFGDRARARQTLNTWMRNNPLDSARASALRRTL